MNGRPWEPCELALLADMYPHCATEDVAAWLGRQPGSTSQAALIRGIYKSAEYMASVSSGRIQRGQVDQRMTRTQFKPGFVPWNKGKPHNPPGSEKGRFRKGNQPATSLPIGSLRICTETSNRQPVLQKKVGNASGAPHLRWVPVARLVWEAANGPVPEGRIVVFRQGMRTVKENEVTVDRLECITRQENARRNSLYTRNPELGRLAQLKGAITRQVNRITSEAQERA